MVSGEHGARWVVTTLSTWLTVITAGLLFCTLQLVRFSANEGLFWHLCVACWLSSIACLLTTMLSVALNRRKGAWGLLLLASALFVGAAYLLSGGENF